MIDDNCHENQTRKVALWAYFLSDGNRVEDLPVRVRQLYLAESMRKIGAALYYLNRPFAKTICTNWKSPPIERSRIS